MPSSEPVRWAGYTSAIIAAVFGLLAAFHVVIPQEQQDAVSTFGLAIVPVIIAVTEWVRSRVTPVKKPPVQVQGP